MQKKSKKYGCIKYLLFLTIFILFIIFMRWCGDNPDSYIEYYIKREFSGRVIKKYFAKSTHYIIRTPNGEIDIAGLNMELINNVEIGDSLIKYKDSNCCLLVKDTVELKLKYTSIREEVLEKSDYLRNIYERKCD